eukprot:CAMPEP_0115077948 /NCGR_PEP_ID=MMETSP0227-20121206/17282_1 /TAXON_ID=89957 /ORGANISM="Polarella glacialis, Strain CCMP 1383" /LENGTH=809 /DNA_ID=CAMNT_0002465289 /DNA_START=121 /DNA_END=2550 /DNA_ORIENTATION=+
MASPVVSAPPGLEEALRQLATSDRWARPELSSDENPSAGAALQVTLVLCGRVTTALRSATASTEKAVAALDAVRRIIGSEIVLAKRLMEILSVEAGCILATGEAAAEQGIAVVADFLSTFVKLEDQLSSQVSARMELEPTLPRQGLGVLVLPTLLECILTGTTRSWECDWEAIQPQLQPLHDLALAQPLLGNAPSVFLKLVREHAPALLPVQPDSDDEDGAATQQRVMSQEPAPRCIYSLACLAQEIYDSLASRGEEAAYNEEISQMVHLQKEVLQRLAIQATDGEDYAPSKQAYHCHSLTLEDPAPPTQAETPSSSSAAKKKTAKVPETPAARTASPKPVPRTPKKAPPAPKLPPAIMTPSPKRVSVTGRTETPPCVSLKGGRIFGDAGAEAKCSGAALAKSSKATVSLAAQTSPRASPDQAMDSIRGFMEEVVDGSGANKLAECLVARAERASSIISSLIASMNAGKGKELPEEARKAAEKLSDNAGYLVVLLELSLAGQAAVTAHVGRLVRCLLDGGSWGTEWRYSLFKMLQLVTHPILAKQSATTLWSQVTDSGAQARQQTADSALAVGSLASELCTVLAEERSDEAARALASMQCLKLSAQLHLQWLRQLVSEVCGQDGASAALPPPQRPPPQRRRRSIDSAAPSCSGAAPAAAHQESCSSESEAEQSEDIGSDETPSAPSIASGDRASDLEDFIDFAPEHNSCGLLRRAESPERGPTSSSSKCTKGKKDASMLLEHVLSPKVLQFYNSKLAPNWEARVRSLLLKRPIEEPATSAADTKSMSDGCPEKMPMDANSPLKRQRAVI